MTHRLCVFFFLAMTVLVALPAKAQQPTPPDASILHVDSSEYPEIDLYVSVFDRERMTPITDLTAANVFVDTDNGQVLTVLDVDSSQRRLHVVVVMDLTGSVSESELANQVSAMQRLVFPLDDDDEVGLVVMDDESARLVSPLSSDAEAMNTALEALTINEDSAGNVYWDGIHAALTVLQSAPAEDRRAVIVMTDVGPGGGTGEHGEDETTALAVENGIEVYGLYFEFEDDGIPDSAPSLPPELALLSEATHGIALGVSAELRAEDDYADDDALPTMMQTVAELLKGETKIAVASPLPVDGEQRGLNLSLTVGGVQMPPLRERFTAGNNPISITLDGVAERENVPLPFSFDVRARTSAGQITMIAAYAVNEAGQRVLIGEVTSDSATMTIEAGSVPPGLFRLVVEASDSAGNSLENDLFLNATEGLSVTLLDVPTSAQRGQPVTITARVGLPASVQSVRLLADGEEAAVQTLGPFDEVTFEWQPQQSGDIALAVIAQDILGNQASQEAQISVVGGGDGGGFPVEAVAIGAFLLGIVAVIGGGSVIVMRRVKSQVMPPAVTPAPAESDRMPSAIISQDATQQSAPPQDAMPPPVVAAGAPIAVAELYGPSGERWHLNPGENTLGRHGSSQIQIRDDSISRYHAKVDVHGRRCFFMDWQASHPSEINGALLQAGTRHELKDGDRIRVGSTLLEFKQIS
jgi:hypothetical protein